MWSLTWDGAVYCHQEAEFEKRRRRLPQRLFLKPKETPCGLATQENGLFTFMLLAINLHHGIFDAHHSPDPPHVPNPWEQSVSWKQRPRGAQVETK